MPVKRLTETGIAKIRPPAKGRMDITDSIMQGLNLRITAKGAKTWCFCYRFGGKQKRMTIGRYPEIDLITARNIVKNAREELAIGVDPCQLREDKITAQLEKEELGMSVKELFDEFFEKHHLHGRHKKETKSVFDSYIIPFFCNKPVRDIKRRDVLEFLNERKTSRSPTSANRALVALRKMFNWAIEQDILEFNPCTHIKKPVPIKERERVFTKSEIKAFWSVCNDIGYPYGPLCQLLLLTGQRRSEITTLKKRYVDLDERIIRIPAENTKANRGQDVPLSDMAIDIINSLPKFSGPYLFSYCLGEKPVDGFTKAKDDIQDRFQAEDWRFHDLRRTCATGMAQLGVPLHTISRVLNHAEGGVTRIYARYSYLNEKRDALNLWAKHIWDIVNEDKAKTNNVVKFGGAL